MAIAISFGGFTIEEIVEWDEDSPSLMTPERFPRRHGSIAQPFAFLGPRIIRLSGVVHKSTETLLKTYIEDLTRKLTELGRDKLIFWDSNRYIWAIKSGLLIGRSAGMAPALAARFAIEFFCDDPFWYAPAETVGSTQSIVASPTTWTVANNGKFRTPPRFEIKAVGADKTDVTLGSNPTGLVMRFSGTITNGNILTIDCAKKSCQMAASNGLNQFTGTFWDLEPGDNGITYVGPTGVDITPYYTEKWPG